ncbi:MAG: cysteine hydrolase family protein [Anaerolineales bacterium]|nr:cysteine hydrolase family protein [Anaerolineales bacterium]
MKTALLVIDIQKDYFPNGRFPLVEPLAAAQKAYMLLQCFREHGGRHIHIQHISLEPDAAFFIRGDGGSDIHDAVAHFEGEPIVYKHYPNAFRETSLLEILKEWGIERVVISGMMTHLCVDATARAAFDLGFKVIVAADACATRDLTYGDTLVPAEYVHKAFLAALKSYGDVMKSDDVIALLADEMYVNRKSP